MWAQREGCAIGRQTAGAGPGRHGPAASGDGAAGRQTAESPPADIGLETSVRYVKGVGPTRAEQLAELGIRTVGDLLMHFPRRFDLRRQAQPMATLRGDEPAATVAGEASDIAERPIGRTPFFQCRLSDETGSVAVRWFHGGYLRDRIKPGIHLAVSGAVCTYKGRMQFINPRFQVIWDPARQGDASSGELGRAAARPATIDLTQDELMPVYPAGGKLSSGHIGRIIQAVLPLIERLIHESLPQEHLQRRGLMGRGAAVAAMHRPEDRVHWAEARRRLAYDECLLMQVGIALIRARQVSRPAWALPNTPRIDGRIRARFGFALTPAQDRAIGEIARDLARDRPMNRLLQGDVGSGKTVVALYAALLAVANGKQAAIMAPTEILAAQHHQKVQAYLAGSRVRTALLVGGQRLAEREAILRGLTGGQIDLVVGTHALITESVQFSRLAVVVVDEQHKFGVRQRQTMRGKGHAPHYLVMTATPIPRTLALTVFGDLDVSIIDALPPGRGRTFTRCITQEKMEEVYSVVAELLGAGQQAFFIYPLVNPSPDLQLTAAEEAHRELACGPLGRFGVGLIHGQMPSARKEAVMADFHAGRIRILAASVVVEVGLDVPAANVMVVMHAERFGLAQLHQLRGRIGRSRQNAVCLLVASPGSPLARQRLAVLERTADGFEIAEEDLRLRGPGEVFGTRQHGLPELKVASLADDLELLRLARRDAQAIVEEDPDLSAPHHQPIRREVLRAYAGRLDLLEGA